MPPLAPSVDYLKLLSKMTDYREVADELSTIGFLNKNELIDDRKLITDIIMNKLA